MTATSSMQYTIGTALERARERSLQVELLVDNHWITGLVAALDGHGVVIDQDGLEHFIVRLEKVSAVRVGAEAPKLHTVPDDPPASAARTFDGAMPMPAPHAASA